MANDDLNIAEGLNNLFKDKKLRMPYNINVIDELHVKANENAHSRILCKLLQYQDADKRFRILESFIQYIVNNCINIDNDYASHFNNVHVENPIITQETERIDLWVQDDKYTIILENKVQGAGDQDKQLERYIDKAKNGEGDNSKQKYDEKNIFVMYLTADSHEPEKQSWGDYYESDIRKYRYVNVSFRDHILPWLKEDVLPNCTLREENLSSALKQYIDYLEGFFNLRVSQTDTYRVDFEQLSILFKEETEQKLFATINNILKKLKTKRNELQNQKTSETDIETINTAISILEVYRNERIKDFAERFSEISRSILQEIYGGIWKDRAYFNRENDACYIIYPDNWERVTNSWKIHLEWKNVSVENLFNNNDVTYTIHFHAETIWDNKNQFLTDLKAALTDDNNSKGKGIWQRDFQIKTEQPLAWMASEKLREELEKIYKESGFKQLIEGVNKTIK